MANDRLAQRKSAIVGRHQAMGEHGEALALQGSHTQPEQQVVLKDATAEGGGGEARFPTQTPAHLDYDSGDGIVKPPGDDRRSHSSTGVPNHRLQKPSQPHHVGGLS